MRNLPLRCLLLAPVAALAACSAPDPGIEILPTEPGSGSAAESAPSSPAAEPLSSERGAASALFGETLTVSVPVGAYEHEFNGDADVAYTVDGVASPAPGEVAFTLTVEVPDLGRVFGMGNMAVTCDAGQGPVEASTADGTGAGEGEAGAHTFAMECAVPEDSGELLIAVEHHEQRLEFTGTPG